MSMMADSDTQYLQLNLRRNRVVLYLGSGFSGESRNAHGHALPGAKGLAQNLWEFLEYPGEYDGTELRYLCDAARKKRGEAAVRARLKDTLTVAEYPRWYAAICGWFWRRIYTTNVDDLVELAFYGARGVASLKRVVAPDEYAERDMLLRDVQYVKLHGSVDDDAKPLTFSPIEYGRRASLHDVWYDHFLRDYCTYPTILVGTELNEPLFWQYLAARQERPRGAPESRPKSFLVSPNISRARADALALYNIQPLNATAEAFFTWLTGFPDFRTPRERILRELDPSLEQLFTMERAGATRRDLEAAHAFFRTFTQVVARSASRSARRDFLLGVQPGWDDIYRDLDADREINGQLAEKLRVVQRGSPDVAPIIVLLGSAGSGKSTVTMRVAYTLALEGLPVYYSGGGRRPDPELISRHLSAFGTRPILVFDNADPDLHLIVQLWAASNENARKPVFLLALRSNKWFQRKYTFQDVPGLEEVEIPDLSPHDIDQILAVLEKEDLLGVLREISLDGRRKVFRDKARKQILVAMREATKGQGFDEILRDEFVKVEPAAAQLLYLITAIPSMHHYHLSQGQVVAAMDSTSAETMALLKQALSGIIVADPSIPERFCVRHPFIAEYVVTEVAPRDLLADAYVRYLQVIAHEIGHYREGRRTRLYRVYRDVINHINLHDAFPQSPHLCEQIYDAVRSHYGHDGHFWLQYGVYELEFGHLDLAENYLLQAQGIMSGSEPVTTAFGHLYFRKAIEAQSLPAAQEYCAEGTKMLRAQVARIGQRDPYPYHVLGSQKLSYIRRWVPLEDQAETLRELYAEIEPGAKLHKLASHLRALLQDIKRAELDTVVRRD
jgi:hypothetical protein